MPESPQKPEIGALGEEKTGLGEAKAWRVLVVLLRCLVVLNFEPISFLFLFVGEKNRPGRFGFLALGFGFWFFEKLGLQFGGLFFFPCSFFPKKGFHLVIGSRPFGSWD